MAETKKATLSNMLNTPMNIKSYSEKKGEDSQEEREEKASPKKEKKTEVILLRVSKSEKERINKLARDQALTPSQYIRTKILGKKEW